MSLTRRHPRVQLNLPTTGLEPDSHALKLANRATIQDFKSMMKGSRDLLTPLTQTPSLSKNTQQMHTPATAAPHPTSHQNGLDDYQQSSVTNLPKIK